MTASFFDAAYATSERPVRLRCADPELAGGMSRALGRGPDLTIEAVRLPSGAWAPHADLAERAVALLVLDGVLARTVGLPGHRRSELVGEGDVICPWEAQQESTTVAAEVKWQILQPARVGVLDSAFFGAARRAPDVLAALTLRSVQRTHRLALQSAIGGLRRIGDRLIALLVHLGDRWGRRTPAGIHLPLRLTHDLIAQLVGAQRPTVTTGLNELERSGRLVRCTDRTWIVSTDALPTARSAL